MSLKVISIGKVQHIKRQDDSKSLGGFIMENRMRVFRLSLGFSGEPDGVCPLYINRQDIKQEIKSYKQKVSPIDLDSYPKLDMDTLKNELFKKGKLRQGWGMELNGINLDLRQDNPDNPDLPSEDWIKNFIKLSKLIWDEDVDCPIAMGRWNILKLMKDMKIGDIIFIPRIPDERNFTVATVKKKYYFEKLNGFIGHGHVIEVEKIKKFSYKNHFPAVIFNPYRRAVCEIKANHRNFLKLRNFINKYY